ncbi:unnamed protein product [Auanema sp. JU1783]|nr:unnamed protein product [Auanema sp. JU1783]
MVRRIDSVSPQKNLRRSGRDRSTIYRSLEENGLCDHVFNSQIEKLVGRANELRERELNTHTKPGYTRGGRKILRYAESEDDFGISDEEERIIPRRSSHRLTRSDNTTINDINDENVTSSELRRNPKRRKIIEEDDNDLDNQLSNDGSTIYDRVKRNRQSETNSPKMRASSSSDLKASIVSPRTQRQERREKREITAIDKEEGDQEDDQPTPEKSKNDEEEPILESSEDEGPRQYSLRTRRNPVERYAVEVNRSEQRSSRFRDDRYRIKDRNHRQNKMRRDYKRRICRSDSSSTGDEDDREFRQSRVDDERFAIRKEISMMKARNRLVPVNLTEKDLSSSHGVIRERLRQTGASCSDIDPMGIDKNVSFEQVGGLGHHIQSLKEVVLFPLLYPDVFKKFDIAPPKGVVFYGPPGTGKTLVARALANECSRGDRKVAFFMRKGADCLSKWVGESERQLRILFDQAYAMRPSIIFFDEIDGLAPVRSSRQDQIHASIVSTLLALMDGLDNRGEVVVIGATNRLDTLDPALRRPGRFDRELKFSLPDVSARKQILNIHTSKWGTNQPSQEDIDLVANNTSGYCGADLKYLCTEAVLISLRSRYPHIYMSSERLKLDLESIKVGKDHILKAMKRITPASRRDLSIPSRPLDDRTSILLTPVLNLLLSSQIPTGYQRSQSINAISSNELEKIVRALEEPPAVPAVRLLLCGSENYSNCGQSSHVLPSLLGRLDHLPVYSLSVGKLFQDGHPEEAFTNTVQSVIRAASSGPCIILLPCIDQWYNVVPLSVSHMLKSAVDQLSGFTGVMLLATTECSYVSCQTEVRQIFRINNCLEIESPDDKTRRKYFEHLTTPAFEEPVEFDSTKYVEPEKATHEDGPARKLGGNEAKELEKLYSNQLREFRIFLRDQLGRLVRDRRFTVFAEPVDEEEAEDYYTIIKSPMCLTDMMAKTDRREYTHPDQFLSDINLIVTNALEYNPSDNLYGKTIRHSAVALRDIVEEYFEKEFDEDFVDKLEETSRLLKEAEITPVNDKLLDLPKGFVRDTKWNVVNCFKNVRKGIVAQANGIAVVSSVGEKSNPVVRRRVVGRMAKYRRATYSSSQKKKKSQAIVKSIAMSLSQGSTEAIDIDVEIATKQVVIEGSDNEEKPEVEAAITSEGSTLREDAGVGCDETENVVDETNEHMDCNVSIKLESSQETNDTCTTNTEPTNLHLDVASATDDIKVVEIDRAQLNHVVDEAIEKTRSWPIPDLERLAAEMTQLIHTYKDQWDRTMLPMNLLKLISDWKL